ncbi:MAG TPA: NUDIX hydrolase [Acetobacteraceae bacterium]|jgi:ADP-ribose pyrophosphatase YjhB (NUDIX family)
MPDFVRTVPEGDNRERLTCPSCGHIDYENPKIVTGSVVAWQSQILLCRRAIAPRIGFWTLPAGYMELGETVADAAMREALEEAEADIVLDGILAVYNISRLSQVQVIFRARFADPAHPRFAPGAESTDVRLFAWNDIPWDNIAFPSVRWSLQAWHDTADRPLGAPAGNPDEDPRGIHRLPATSGALP